MNNSTPRYDVFISYSRKDTRDFAIKIADSLERLGVSLWIDEGIDAGSEWPQSIARMIDASEIVVVLATRKAVVGNDWVRQELELAQMSHKTIIPLLLEWGVKLPEALQCRQYIDFTGTTDEQFSTAMDELYEQVKWRLTPQTAALRRSLVNQAHLYQAIFSSNSNDDLFDNDPVGNQCKDIQDALIRDIAYMLTEPVCNELPHALISSRLQPEPASVSSLKDVLDVLPEPFEWIDIPGGQVTLEDGLGTFDVPEFEIAKYPITNAQFQAFIDAPDGYYDSKWWHGLTSSGEEYSQPGDPRWEFADYPCQSVSWYQAFAFCQWLSFRLNLDITLPTEQQWQRAAQGDDGRKFPWGNQFHETRCNTRESLLMKTTPVTMYPSGASPYGVMDMSGNVWEWCLNEYTKPDQTEFADNVPRVMRGGSWGEANSLVRGTARHFDMPSLQSEFVGFRVVRGYSP